MLGQRKSSGCCFASSDRETIIRHLEQRIRTLEQSSCQREQHADSLERQVWLLQEELQVQREAKHQLLPSAEKVEKLLAHISWLETERDTLRERLSEIQLKHQNLQPVLRLLEDSLTLLSSRLEVNLSQAVVKGLHAVSAEEWQGRDIAVVTETIKQELDRNMPFYTPHKSSYKPRTLATEPYQCAQKTDKQGLYVVGRTAASTISAIRSACQSPVLQYPKPKLPRQYRRCKMAYTVSGNSHQEMPRPQQRWV